MSAAGRNPTTASADAGESDDRSDAGSPRAQPLSVAWLPDSDWELTWPIWHMLPRQERKEIALAHGAKTIGEFEEYMTLQRAMHAEDRLPQPYPNELIYSPGAQLVKQAVTSIEKQAIAKRSETEENDDEEHSDEDARLEEKIEQERLAATERLPVSELVKLGGYILLLPEEMLHRIFEWLPVDTYGVLARVSPHWKSFTRTETVYKRLCERLYLNQSKRRQLHVGRFGNSYRAMLEKRPRVRAGGGVYVMKYSRVKPIQRDMWTEVPRGAILELTYYRYLYFLEDGRALYALTTQPPHEVFRRFRRYLLTRELDATFEIVMGSYSVQKRHVTVSAQQSWQHVQLELTILDDAYHGRWGILSFDQHVTSMKGSFDWNDRFDFEIPDGEPFRFIKDRHL